MEKADGEQYLGKLVRIITSNRFHFSGKVIDVSKDSLILIDKFEERVTINLKDVMICQAGANNGP